MEQRALDELYGRYGQELFVYLLSLSRSPQLAEDLVQETFLKALLSLPEGHPNLRAWLYMVGRNLWLNHCRRAKREEPLPDAPLPGGEDPLTGILKDERRRLLYAALDRLDGRKREILLLQYFGGMNQREIAAVLHLSVENVRVLAHRGRKELRAWMEENGYDLS